jgi:peroxiredoxin
MTVLLLVLLAGLALAWPQPGEPAPNFSVPDTAGVYHSLASYRGSVVQLFFWAST